MNAAPWPSYTHLTRLSDSVGLFEHAKFETPRVEEGYCLDDVSRGLIVAARHAASDPVLAELTRVYLNFVDEAISENGAAHNRRNVHREWTDSPAVGDWWGRAIWALGVSAKHLTEPQQQVQARESILRAMTTQSPFVRSNVFATIGAAALLSQEPELQEVRNFLEHSSRMIPTQATPSWIWPEERLTYGNASLTEALIAAGAALKNQDMLEHGLCLLDFLVATETFQGNLSVTGVGGRRPDSPRPQFDQQPIEVSALADACVQAYQATGDPSWLSGLTQAWRWFNGDNDSMTEMYDLESGAGFDGLERDGRNENRGAESTLAALSTHQHFFRYEAVIQASA